MWNPFRSAEPEYPEFYRRHLDLTGRRRNGKRPVAELEFVVLDTETTGMDPGRDQLLSIGAVRIEGRMIRTDAVFSAFLPPPAKRRHSADDIAVHGILPSGGEVCRPAAEVLPELLDFLGDRILVAHHAGFDLAMLNQALLRLGAGKIRNTVVDTVRLAQRLQPPGYWRQPKEYGLDQLARQYNIPLSDRHTALGDAYITANLLLKLLHRLHDRGVITEADLMARLRR